MSRASDFFTDRFVVLSKVTYALHAYNIFIVRRLGKIKPLQNAVSTGGVQP